MDRLIKMAGNAQINNQLISIASHELNTPITALKLQLQMMQRSVDGGADENLMRSLDNSVEQIDRLIAVVQTFIEVTQAQMELIS